MKGNCKDHAFQRYFRDMPAGVKLTISAGDMRTAVIINPPRRLLAELDINVRIVSGLWSMAPGLMLVQVELLCPDCDECLSIDHGQTSADYFAGLLTASQARNMGTGPRTSAAILAN